MVVLDTDLLTLVQHKRGKAVDRLSFRLGELTDDEIAATIISYEEQMRGWLALLSAARDMAGQVEVYRRLSGHVRFFADIQLLPFDEPAAVEFQRLRAAKVRIGTMDLRIAAIALSRGATLLSRNLADVAKVPGLAVEDWSA